MKRVFLLVLIFIVVATALVFSGGGREAAEEKLLLTALCPGDPPSYWDELLPEINGKLETSIDAELNIVWIPWNDYGDKSQVKISAGEDFESMLDAPWLHMEVLIGQGAFLQLGDLIEEHGPAIKENFDPSYLAANMFKGAIYGLPFTNFFAFHQKGIRYRADLAEKYGIDEITSYDDLERLLRAIKANESGMIPYSYPPEIGVGAGRQFALADEPLLLDGLASRILQPDVNLDRKEIRVYVVTEEPAFVDFNRRLNTWYKEGLVDLDILSRGVVVDELMHSGKAATRQAGMMEADTSFHDAQLKANVPEGRIDYAKIDVPGKKYVTDFMAFNFQCFNVNGANPERMMQLFNWIFEDQANYDLMQYGIEGKHWTEMADGSWDYGPGFDATNFYNFPGYTMLWNINFDRDAASLRDHEKEFLRKAKRYDSYTPSPLIGFTFDPEPVTNELAQVAAIDPETIWLLNTGTVLVADVKDDFEKRWRQAGLYRIKEEFEQQLAEFLESSNSEYTLITD